MRLRGLTAASLLFLARAAAAQTVTPGTVDDFLREAPRIKPNQTPAPTITPPAAPTPKLKAQVQISGLTFSDTPLYTPAELQAMAQPYIKPRMSLEEILGIAQHVTDRMHADGYLLASAVVPSQKVKNGLVHVDILEGKLESVHFHGNQGYSEARLKPYLDVLTRQPALTDAALERGLLLLNELPGVTARGALAPGERFGTADLDVEIGETHYRAAASVNNYGSPELGRDRLDLSLDLYNPLHLGDHANLRVIDSSASLLKLGRFGYDVALAPGWRANVAIARVDYSVAGSLTAADLSGNSLTREASLSYALARSHAVNLTVTGGARDVRSSQQALGQSLGSNNVHLGFAQLSGYTSYGGGLTSGVAAVSSNGKGEAAPGTAGDGVRLKTEFDVTHMHPLPHNFEVSQRLAAAFSADTLPDTEKFSLGGPDSVRAFPIAQVRGDQGLLSVTELRKHFAISGFQSYAGVFFDTGYVQIRQPGLAAKRDSLSGAGITFCVVRDPSFRIKIDYAHPFGGDVAADGKRSRIWASGTWFF
jgi:hemolysin activation/secretion protein